LATETTDTIIFSSNGKTPEVRSSAGHEENAITELISARLPFVVRWGTLLFFLLLCVLVFIAWLVQYPDVVYAKAKINSVNPPREIVAKSNGRLLQLRVNNGDTVKAGSILGVLECIGQPEAVALLQQKTDTLYNLMLQNRTTELVAQVPALVQSAAHETLGELQPAYEVFIGSLVEFKDYLHNGFYLRKRTMLAADEQYLQRQYHVLLEQQQLLQEDVAISKETFQANENLYHERVIAPLDYRNEKSKFLVRKLSLPQVSTALITNEAQRHEKRKEIAELENQIEVQKNRFVQALQTLRSKIEEWKNLYLLRASIDGTVSLQGFLQEQQQVKTGQLLMVVIPNNSAWYAEALVPQYNFGKVQNGQAVQLKLHAYPYEQYGEVSGEVVFISATPVDSGFLVKVALPFYTKTSRNIQLPYRHSLTADAAIITKNRRLLERFTDGIKGWRSY
jgi:HlyD family secretion protein